MRSSFFFIDARKDVRYNEKEGGIAVTAINATTARKNLYQLISSVNMTRSPVTITNARGQNAVLLSEADWNAVQETLYLNADPKVASSILAADEEPLSSCKDYDPGEVW